MQEEEKFSDLHSGEGYLKASYISEEDMNLHMDLRNVEKIDHQRHGVIYN